MSLLKSSKMKITEKELKLHRRLMTDFIYAAIMPKLLDIRGQNPDKVLSDFRENHHRLLKKYGCYPTFNYYIDFNGEIIEKG